MSDFYDYLNGGGRQQPSLPIANPRRPAPPSPPPKATAANLINSANSRIEQAKQALYDKIDVCCAQYGLYGLQIMEQAITQSLSVMINGGNPVAPQRQPQYAPPPPPPPRISNRLGQLIMKVISNLRDSLLTMKKQWQTAL